MRYRLPIVLLVAFTAICCVSVEVDSNAEEGRKNKVKPAARGSEQMRFRNVETPNGPMVQVEVGDMVFRSSELTFLHGEKSVTRVRPKGGRVEMRRGESIVTAGRVDVALYRSPLGTR